MSVSPKPHYDAPPYILIGADGTHVLKKTEVFPGYFVTPPLGIAAGIQQGKGVRYTLRQIFVEYMSDSQGTLRMNFSGDGGVTFGDNYNLTAVDTNGAIGELVAGPTVTGVDVRVKFTVPDVDTFILVAYSPVLVIRGNP